MSGFATKLIFLITITKCLFQQPYLIYKIQTRLNNNLNKHQINKCNVINVKLLTFFKN